MKTEDLVTTSGAAAMTAIGAAFALLSAPPTNAQLVESFDSVTALTPSTTEGQLTGSGWMGKLRSSALGLSGIFQGNPVAFPSQAGPSDGYLAMNQHNASGTGTISTWAISPVLNMANGDTFSFYTRTITGGGVFPDRLEVRLSDSDASLDVGATSQSVGAFTKLLSTINPSLTAMGYPETWTQFSTTISGLAGPTSGRLAFRYFVENGGPTGPNSNFIGIDSFRYSGVPEPAEYAVMAGLALIGFAFWRRRAGQ